MERQPGNLIVVYMIEPQAIGSYFDLYKWPLHITLLPWISVSPAEHRAVQRELEHISETMAPFRITVGKAGLFGPNKDIPVHVIADQKELQAVHFALVGMSRLLQLTIIDETYIGDHHIAHITKRTGRRQIDTGDVMSFDGFYVVKLLKDNVCQVMSYYPLKGQGDA